MIVYAVSSSSCNYFPMNTRTDFKNLISEPLNYQYSHCALEECYFEASFNTIVEPQFNMSHIAVCSTKLVQPILDYIELYSVEKNTTFSHEINSTNYTITFKSYNWETCYVYIVIKSGVYKSVLSVIWLLNWIFKKAGVEDIINFSQSEINGKCILKSSAKFVYISQKLMNLLGFNKNWYIYTAAQLGNLTVRPGLIRPDTFAMKYYAVFGSKTMKANNPPNFNLFLPSLIKITSDEVHHSLLGSKSEKILSVIPGPQNNFTMFKHSILNPAYIPLISRGLKRLSFSILDQNNNHLKLGVGSACYLKLKMADGRGRKFDQLTLYSNDKDAMMMRETNHASDFTTPLAKTLHMHDTTKGWTMNLKRVTLPAVINNITSDICNVKISNSFSPFDDGNIYSVFNLQHGCFNTGTMIEVNFNSLLANYEVNIKYDIKKNRFTISNISENNIQIEFNPVMNLVLGISFGEIKSQSLLLPPNIDYICDYEADINIGRPRYARIVCSLLKHTIFGAVNCKLLRFITLKHSTDSDISSYEFVNDSPMAIAATSLDTIDLKVLNEHNDICLEFGDKIIPSTFSIEIVQD